MAELQRALIDRAAGWLAPGGTLVYSVCSLEREEGEGQPPPPGLAPVRIEAGELPAGLAPSADGWLHTDPGMLPDAGGLDGFFVVRWRR
jgi:16S rRNA (cytosine967-C5)-methyltransferase